MSRGDDWHLNVPVWAVELVLDPWPRRCNVCLGESPSWDGHDVNPPCIGRAREMLSAILADGDRTLR